MPFPNQPLKGLNDREVEPYDGVSGCYAMTDARWGVIYIGMGDIGAELRRYANGANPAIARLGPTHFLASIVQGETRERMHAREIALIREYRPPANDQHN